MSAHSPSNLEGTLRERCLAVRRASRTLATASREAKDALLQRIAAGLRQWTCEIASANEADVDDLRSKGGTKAFEDRLRLDAGRIEAVARSVEEVMALADPVGEVVSTTTRPNGLRVSRVRVPLGVVAMIYEARPNVTIDASVLCLKTGNGVVLRGGSEAFRTNQALGDVVRGALDASGLPEDLVYVVPFTDREAVLHLVRQVESVDLAIPRGGESLIRFVTENARVPVVQHFKGVCHMFVDVSADLAMAEALVVDAKLSRPGVCNALECLLVDAKVAPSFVPKVVGRMVAAGGKVLGCPRTRALDSRVDPASPQDFGREFLDVVLAVRVVDGLDDALDHVRTYGSGHTEAIVTADGAHADRFRREVDAACVVVNASTRFHDGGELGLGAEIGIATSRLHWRGPMGLESLTTMKWVVDGSGQTRHG
ncbi:MAG: glutamate-5-semialdehyde dehydrogenase [Polyangiaceae bacterium]